MPGPGHETLLAAIEHLPETVVVTDPDGVITYANPALESMTGFAPRELVGATFKALASGKTPRATFDSMWAALKAGKGWRGEFVNVRKDGAEYVERASISPVFGSDGRIEAFVAIKEDITLLRRAEDHLSERQRLLHAILSSSPVGIALLRGGKFLWSNGAFSEITGWSRDEIRAHPFEDLVPDLSAEAAIRELAERARSGEASPVDLWLERKGGERFYARLQARTVDPAAPDHGVVISLSDQTEARRLSDSLADSVSELTKRNEAIEEQRRIIEREKERGDALVSTILPQSVAEEMLLGNEVTPKRFERATVMFTDFVGFSALASETSPELLIAELNDMFSAFDAIMEKRGCERIKTLGDGYLAISGAPVEREDHADAMLDAAIDCFRYLRFRNSDASPGGRLIEWKIRIGINSGPVVGGIIGTRKRLYDVIGDTVNVASRLQSTGETMRVHVGASTKALASTRFAFSEPRKVPMKNVGTVETYYLEFD
jgi:PAS domain S-box-containing protein